MARSNNIFLNVLLPIITFVPLSFIGYELLFGHMQKAGLIKSQEYCPIPFEGKAPFQLHYLGGYVPAVENILCILVSFFHPIIKSDTTFVIEMLTALAPCAIVPFFEATRANRPFLLAFPMIMGLVYQLFGAAVVFPVFWALFLAMTRDHATGSQIDQADAEAVLFGLGMGYVLPTFAMIYIPMPEVIALWQPFPAYIVLFQRLHLLLRPRHIYNTSGYRTVQATYILLFIGTTIAHLRTWVTHDLDPYAMMNHLLPSLAVPDVNKGHTSLTSILHFLQWDLVVMSGTSFLASFWFVDGFVQGVMLTLWVAFSCVVLGPGAAVSGIFLWRESKLNQARLNAAKLEKTQ